jgi:hypothetical protein
MWLVYLERLLNISGDQTWYFLYNSQTKRKLIEWK